MVKVKGIIAAYCFFMVQPSNSEIYKWIDENGDTHFSDVPHQQENTKKISVNTYRSSDKGKASLQREKEAIRGIEKRNYKKKKKVKKQSNNTNRISSSGNEDKRNSFNCLRAKEAVSRHQKAMKRGYSSSQAGYMRSRQRALSENRRSACKG